MRIGIIQEISLSGVHKVLGSSIQVCHYRKMFHLEIHFSLNLMITKKNRMAQNQILPILNKPLHYFNLLKKNLNEKVALVIAYLVEDLEVLLAKLLKKDRCQKLNKVSLFFFVIIIQTYPNLLRKVKSFKNQNLQLIMNLNFYNYLKKVQMIFFSLIQKMMIQE